MQYLHFGAGGWIFAFFFNVYNVRTASFTKLFKHIFMKNFISYK